MAVASTVTGAVLATRTVAIKEKKVAEAKESTRAANLKVTTITVDNCTDCFNVDEAVASLKKQNVSIGEEKTLAFDAPEAQSLVAELGIKRLPTYVATGEVTKSNIEGFVKSNGEVKNGTFVFTNVTPVFVDVESKEQRGRLSVTYVTDPSCTQCIDPKLTVEAYKKAGVKISEEKTVAWDSEEGKKLIGQYTITKLPTFLLSADASYYPSLKDSWSRIGTTEPDGTYVARQIALPYRDLEKKQIVGLVDVIYLTDSRCSECYNPQDYHKNILTGSFGIGLRSEKSFDVNTAAGAAYVNKYKITQVPTFLISPEVNVYTSLTSAWTQVGTVESDGWYVFKQVSLLGNVTYKDLSKDQIIRPQPQPTPQQ